MDQVVLGEGGFRRGGGGGGGGGADSGRSGAAGCLATGRGCRGRGAPEGGGGLVGVDEYERRLAV